MWDIWDVRCSGCGMLGMRNVGDAKCWGCGSLGMWYVGDVGCLGCGMWDVGCGMFCRDVGC